MRIPGLFLVFSLLLFEAHSQYYYNEQILTQQASQKQQISALAKVYSIDFLSFDGEGKPIEDLKTQQKYKKDYSESNTVSRLPIGSISFSRSLFDKQYRLIQQTDSGEDHRNVTSYRYDTFGKISQIMIGSQSAGGFTLQEEHIWSYDSKGDPISMLKIKNGGDSLWVNFVTDEKGHVVEENSKRRGIDLPSVYYYYDASGRLTDVVRYNQAVKKLLPDYIFEYDEKGRIATMVVIPEGSNEYQKWYYLYDEEGLKQLDACYSKNKQLIGKVEYQYKYYE